jgi:hypothetical protein
VGIDLSERAVGTTALALRFKRNPRCAYTTTGTF